MSSSAFINGGVNNDTIYCTGYECAVHGDEGDDEIHVQLHDVGSAVYGGSGNDKDLVMDTPLAADEGDDYLSLTRRLI